MDFAKRKHPIPKSALWKEDCGIAVSVSVAQLQYLSARVFPTANWSQDSMGGVRSGLRLCFSSANI